MERRAERNVGLDLLRLLAMVMVVILHILGQGGILDAALPGSLTWYTAWGLECLCYCAVDCYGLLSGYLGGGRKRPFSALVLLWLEVVLYSLLYYVLFRLWMPESVGKQELFNAVFPVLRRQYWYFTGYFGLTLLMPLLNAGLERIESRQATAMTFLLLLFFCAFPTVLASDAFRMHGGYTLLWLALLYLMGALIRRSAFFQSLGVFPLILISVFCNALTFATVLRPVTIPGLSSFTLLNYVSPTVTVFAVCLLLLFSRLPIRGSAAARLIARLSKPSFGVYILHTNPLLWLLVYRPGSLGSWASRPAWALAFLVPACAVGVYLALSLPDILRALLFRKLHLREGLEYLEQRIFDGGDRREKAADHGRFS